MLMKLIIGCALLNWPSFNWQYIEYLLSFIVIKSTMQLILFWFLIITETVQHCPNLESEKWLVLFSLIIYSENAKSLFALSRSKTKLCINTIQFWYFQYQSLSPSSPRVLWLTLGSRVRTVLCSLRFLCCLGPQSLLQPRVTADPQTQTPLNY